MAQGGVVGRLDWKMVRRRQWYAVAKLAAAMASSVSPLRMQERARGRKCARESRQACRGGVEALPGQTGGAHASIRLPDGERGLMTVGHHPPDLNRHETFQFD